MKFEQYNFAENIQKALNALGYLEMTPIQEQAIPVVTEGADVIAQAPTGTGKTCSFALPAIQKVDSKIQDVQVLVLCPTRELAVQVTNEIRRLLQYTEKIKALTLYGGQSIDLQIKSMKGGPQIIVGTPGRILDHLRRKTLKLQELKMLVLDEADEMLQMGFREDLDTILQSIDHDHQTLLFSATMPDEIKQISKLYQKKAITIRTTHHEASIPDIKQSYTILSEMNKVDCLSRMMDTYHYQQALVFCRTKKKVDELSIALTSRGYPVECLHGDLKQAGRDKVMEMFRQGIVKVLIATDVAARGLDIQGIDVIFNYDIPDDVEYYIHRIGRTARAGRSGAAYTFVSRREVERIKSFSKTLKTDIVQIEPPTYQEAESSKVRHLLDQLIVKAAQTDLNDYMQYIYTALLEASQEITVDQLAASFLQSAMEGAAKYKDAGQDLSEKKENKRKDFTRIFINLGKMDQLSKADLVEIIRTNRHVDRGEIDHIDMLNTYSFFEIPDRCVAEVLKELNAMSYRGRKIAVEVSATAKRSASRSDRANNSERTVRVSANPRSRTEANRYGDSERAAKPRFRAEDKPKYDYTAKPRQRSDDRPKYAEKSQYREKDRSAQEPKVLVRSRKKDPVINDSTPNYRKTRESKDSTADKKHNAKPSHKRLDIQW